LEGVLDRADAVDLDRQREIVGSVWDLRLKS
jgi:hypothetical protein